MRKIIMACYVIACLYSNAIAQHDSNSNVVDLTTQQESLLKEFSLAAQKLQDRYSTLSMTVQTTHTLSKLKREQLTHFYRVGDEKYRVQTVEKGQDSELNTVVTPERGYIFLKESGKSEYSLVSKDDTLKDREGTISTITAWGVHCAPFAFFGYRLNDYIKQRPKNDPDSQEPLFSQVTEKVTDRGRVITFTKKAKENSLPPTFSFYRDHYWALKEMCDPFFDENGTCWGNETTICDYDFREGEFPKLKLVTTIQYNIDNEATEKKERIISSLCFEEPDLSIFDPKQFLPPEASGVGNELTRADITLTRIFLMGIGVFLIALGLWMKIRKHQAKAN